MTAHVSWEPVGKGGENILCITVGGETFVRPDWDAYAMGYSACKDDVRRAAQKLLDDLEKRAARSDSARRGANMLHRADGVESVILLIDTLPPKEVDDE